MNILKNLLICFDQAINCLIRIDGEWGRPDEMLSARAWRVRDKRPQYAKWIDRLFFWDADHCAECFEIEQQRKQLPWEYRA